jgi:hypothetical protein
MAVDNVELHLLLIIKGCAAERALVHAAAEVLDLVQLEHVVVPKALLADVAAVGLLPRVGPRVNLQLL